MPTALYCFLRNTQSENSFKETLEYTISLGGDTDTIASMACSLSGAYLGDSKIPRGLVERCEGFEELETLADDLLSESANVARER